MLEYSFVLNWDELDEELRERKIDEYVESFSEGEREGCSEEELRQSAEYQITTRFPMYF